MAGTANELLEKEFQKNFQDLVQLAEDPNAPPGEFQRLQDLWRKLKENETRLGQRCRELQTQLAANKARALATAARSREDQAKIASLKKEIENAWKMVDEAHEKDQKSRETIQRLQQEVEQLGRIVEHSTSLALTQERLAELQKAKDELTEEIELLQSEMVEANEKLESSKQKIENQQEEINTLEIKLEEAYKTVQNKDSQLQREVRLREKQEIDLRQAKVDLTHFEKTVHELQTKCHEKDARIKEIEEFSDVTKALYEKARDEFDNLQIRHQNLGKEHEAYQRKLSRLNDENLHKEKELKRKEDEFLKLITHNNKLIKLRDSLYIKIQKLNEQNCTTTQQSEILRGTLCSLEKEADAARKQALQDEKVIDELFREKSIMNKNLIKTVTDKEKQSDLLLIYEEAQCSFEQEILKKKEELAKQQKVLSNLEKERDKLQYENGELKSKIVSLTEDIKAKETLIFDYKKKMAKGDMELQQQKGMYDTLKSERNMYSKNLVECQEEILDLKRKLKSLDHQLEHLKEDLTNKESELFREQHNRQKSLKEKESLRIEMQQTRANQVEWKSRSEKLEVEEKKLLKQLKNIEEENEKQKQYSEKIAYEKNSLLTQFTEKVKEATTLQEAIKDLQLMNKKKEVEHQILLDDIRLLKLQIERLQKENITLNRSLTRFEDLQNKISSLEKELMHEKLKAKALETELGNPHNVHRWRRLAGSDPTTYELIQKTHILQKRLIAKTEEALDIKTSLEANEQAKLDTQRETKQRLSSAMSDRVLDLQKRFTEREKQVKSLLSEQKVYLTKIEEHKNEIVCLKQELSEAKFKILLTKKEKKYSPCEAASENYQVKIINNKLIKAKSLGSGFRIMSASVTNLN